MIFEKNSRIFIKKLKDLDKKLKEFCPKLSNLATLSWWWLLKIGQKKSLLIHIICRSEVVCMNETSLEFRHATTRTSQPRNLKIQKAERSRNIEAELFRNST